MKFSELTTEQCEKLADLRPDWMAEHRPDLMVEHRPDWDDIPADIAELLT